MNRNDETKLLTESEKEARTAARTARHRRPDIDAFKCMKHIIEETNRYNISAVAAALHSYIRSTIEKIAIFVANVAALSWRCCCPKLLDLARFSSRHCVSYTAAACMSWLQLLEM